MADLSKIKLNGTEYDLKDAVARAAMSNVNMPGAVLDEEVIAMMAELGYAVPVTDENNEPLTNNGSQILG